MYRLLGDHRPIRNQVNNKINPSNLWRWGYTTSEDNRICNSSVLLSVDKIYRAIKSLYQRSALVKTRAFRVRIHQRLRHLLERYVRGTKESFAKFRTSDAAQLIFEDCVAVITPWTLSPSKLSLLACCCIEYASAKEQVSDTHSAEKKENRIVEV
jgi:hypothetical protein